MIDLTQAVDLGNGWSFVEVRVPITERWPGFASVIVSPVGDVAIMGDGNAQSFPYEADDDRQAADDVRWAKRVIGTPTAVWPVTA